MADVTCDKFKPMSRDADTGNVKWSAAITPAPNALWRKVFFEGVAVENSIGNFTGRNLNVGNTSITFESPDTWGEAAVSVLRRVIERTNRDAAKLAAEIERAQEAERRRQAESDDALRRLKDKYKDGI